ncbi:inositol monophosphatase family protein [Rhizosphaericola mali]|uniref:Inositol-1-monophosphatase n=1 Tax=Rhizosphaericola mali TaxID=2545455 RepID=A0A5P2G325_9BACT|nr:inositol monophosphatase family protein [Rhizosphaericola mali]QES90206.1 inositol monophosphatase [Rhizosphaericola mali]
MENLKNTLIEAAKAGAERAAFYFNKKHQIINKDGVNNPVTEADKASEKAIFEVIKSNFPDHFLLSEESGEIAKDSEYKWIIDPIDGTINYAQNIPICCISIGVEKAGEMILGAVYNPFMNEFFLAEKGKGATLNDAPIHVSEQTSLEKSCLATGFPYEYIQDPNGPIPVFERFISQGIALRRLGSAALDLCWTACGRYDGFYEHGLIASNGLIHNTLVDIISPK